MTRTEKTYYLLTALYRLAWAALGPVYALFLLDRGLDLLQISLVLATYLIATCLFEVPTGAIADVFGRKASFILSCLVRSAAFGLYYFSDSFAEFLVAEFIDAVGTTLATGAFDAWAVDGIRDEGDHRPVDRLFARGQMLGQGTAIISGLGGAYLADIDFSLPWLIGTSGFLLCALVGMVLMRETHRPPVALSALRGGAYLSIGRMMHESIVAVRGMPVMRGLCLLTLASSFAAVPTYQTWQPRLTELAGEGPWLMGWVWALVNLAGLLGGALVAHTVGRWGRARALFVARLWRAATLGVAALATNFPLALIGFLLQEVTLGFSEPVMTAWMNEHATSERRATMLSVRSMSWTLGGATGLVCLGWLARDHGIANAWLASAAIYALVAPGFLLLGRLARRTAAPAATVAVAPHSA
jgi:MFS family permease